MTSLWTSILLCLLISDLGFAWNRGRGKGRGHGKELLKLRQSDKCDRSIDFAIIGGGPSGTYSAYRLRNESLDIELFEYSNRIGGRLYTSRLPNTPDVNLELGGMRFIDGVHPRLQGLVDELGLTPKVFFEGFGKPGRLRYFLRGQSLTTEQIKSGDIPYNLSPEEKANQANIYSYYLEKLTGFNGDVLPRDQVLKLKLLSDGRELYKLTIDEALDLVATPEGKAFAKDRNIFESEAEFGTSAVNLFNENLGEYALDGEVYTLEEGMSAFPQTLLQAFLDASTSHRVSMNKKLDAIEENDDGRYILKFVETETKDGYTTEKKSVEYVCADKVILGMPQNALTKLQWAPLQSGPANEALNAVKPCPASKVFMTFSAPWWLSDDALYPANVTKSDTDFSQMYDWKQSNASGDYIMISSYADISKTVLLEAINEKGTPIPGSAVGFNKVTDLLRDDILDNLAKAFGIQRDLVLNPVTAVSQWWTDYPFGGGWALWKPGVHFDDAKATIRKPSLTHDIFIVGADHAFGSTTSWIEGALETVDDIFDAYLV